VLDFRLDCRYVRWYWVRHLLLYKLAIETDVSVNSATSCSSGLLENKGCVSSCSTGNYAQGTPRFLSSSGSNSSFSRFIDGTCLACSTKFDGAAECTAESISRCDGDHLLQSGACVSQCGDGFFPTTESTCLPCTGPFPNALTCTSSTVTTCAEGYVKEGSASCVTDCAAGEYSNGSSHSVVSLPFPG
jgi:hypothetical protein